MESVCLVAILKDEEPFLDEWILYHRMLGIDHFYLYDDNPLFPLKEFLLPYKDFVTVINWYGLGKSIEGRSNQVKAYTHALKNYAINYDWVVYIDGDEFIVLRKNRNLKDYLTGFKHVSSISLNWYLFGHNGYFDNPDGPITSSLTRRMKVPYNEVKSLTRPKAISQIITPHFCKLKYGLRVDGNGKIYNDYIYPGKVDTAHVNHYHCRSFQNWMNRSNRGSAVLNTIDIIPKGHEWRLSEDGCLRRFVEYVAKNDNEYIDTYMYQYKLFLDTEINKIEMERNIQKKLL
jgi:hypothetical protein